MSRGNLVIFAQDALLFFYVFFAEILLLLWGSCHDAADVPYPKVPAHILHPHSTPGPKFGQGIWNESFLIWHVSECWISMEFYGALCPGRMQQ